MSAPDEEKTPIPGTGTPGLSSAGQVFNSTSDTDVHHPDQTTSATPLEPGWYWVRMFPSTSPELLDKYKLPHHYDRVKLWDGKLWISDGDAWHYMTMEQFKANGFLVGPKLEKPGDNTFRKL